jgi:hypothetical protein
MFDIYRTHAGLEKSAGETPLPTTLSCTTGPVLMNLLLEMREMMKVLDQKLTTKTDPLSFTIDSIKREIKEYFSKFNKCIKLLN